MTTVKDLALQAANNAFQDGVKNAAQVLVNGLILAKTDQDKQEPLQAHERALAMCRAVLDIQRAAIEAQFKD